MGLCRRPPEFATPAQYVWQAFQDYHLQLSIPLAESRLPEGQVNSAHKRIDNLGRIIQSPGASPAHLVGHSYGAFLCLLLAISAPYLVRSLTLPWLPVISMLLNNKPGPTERVKQVFIRPHTVSAIARLVVFGLGLAKRTFLLDNYEYGLQIFGNAVFGRGGYERMPKSRKTKCVRIFRTSGRMYLALTITINGKRSGKRENSHVVD